MPSKARTALAKLLENVTDNNNFTKEVVNTQNFIKNNFEKKSMSILTTGTKNSIGTDEQLIHSLDPNKCYLWKFADRPDDELGDIDSLAESIKRVGQQEPILVRPSQEESSYEIIFGNRRWRACQLAKVNVKAIIQNVSDQDCALIQREENSARENISDYAIAKNYDKLLKAQIFTTEKELSQHLNISPQYLNDIFAYLRVPKQLVEVLPNFKNMSRRLVVKLASLSKEAGNLSILINYADDINNKKITSSNIDDFVKNKIAQQEKIIIPKEVIRVQYKNKTAFEIDKSNKRKLTIKISSTISSKKSTNELINCLKNLYNMETE